MNLHHLRIFQPPALLLGQHTHVDQLTLSVRFNFQLLRKLL